MHVEVIASRYEAFGRITIEAMLNELPVIGANSAGTAELITDGVTGLLYPSGNVSKLSDALEMTFNNYDNALAMAKNAFIDAQKYTEGNTARRIERLFP